MRHAFFALLAAIVILSGCDATTSSEAAASSSDEIIAAHAAAFVSGSCTAPTVAFGSPAPGGYLTVVVTPANSTDVSASIEEKLTGTPSWYSVLGASYNGSSVTYTSGFAPSHPRSGYTASYRARTLCANGSLSAYSNTVTSWVEP